jgi:hypothetical protein
MLTDPWELAVGKKTVIIAPPLRGVNDKTFRSSESVQIAA